MNRILLTAALLVSGWSALGAQAALSTDVDVSVKVDDGVTSTKELVNLSAASPLIDLEAALSVNSDGKYGADIANFKNSHSFFDNYFLMEKGFTTLHLNPIEFQVGRLRQQDHFDSPYSLFINSNNPSTVGSVLKYQDAVFGYESRWILLNARSDLGGNNTEAWTQINGTGFPDRGANLKTLTFKVNHQTFGIQDAAVYTGRNFDLEYFVSPMPSYFIQYFYGTAGRPWTTSSNENNLIGFFWTWEDPLFKVGAQVLIDDFSLHFLFPNEVPNNPWKAAWTLGGQWTTDEGVFGLYHAGALKYTFEPIDSAVGKEEGSAYGYTLYPDTVYGVNGTMKAFDIEDNALGYTHGENNLAILATWSKVLARNFSAATQVEFLLAGANSPANPWHDALGSDEVGTHWIDDPVLQKSITWALDLRWNLDDWQFYCITKLGGVWNALELQRSTAYGDSTASALDQYIKIYKPSDNNKLVAALSLGVSYHWDISSTLEWMKTKVP